MSEESKEAQPDPAARPDQHDEYRRAEGNKHIGPASTSPYPVSRLAPAHDLVNVAREIAESDRAIGSVVGGKLGVIADQIRLLQEEANRILKGARRDLDLHRARCNFKKRPGAFYHLYEKADGALYFSMLSSDDWGGAPPHTHRGSYRLEADLSWTPVEEITERAEGPEQLVQRLLRGQ